jgi:hypothetical protein
MNNDKNSTVPPPASSDQTRAEAKRESQKTASPLVVCIALVGRLSSLFPRRFFFFRHTARSIPKANIMAKNGWRLERVSMDRKYTGNGGFEDMANFHMVRRSFLPLRLTQNITYLILKRTIGFDASLDFKAKVNPALI